jgi:predicted nucleic acid-binding protein
MAIYFLDTSAIVKRYIAEPGQAWVLSLCDPAQQHDLYISQITLVEVVATICRRAREQSISLPERDRLVAAFRQDSSTSYNLWPVSPEMFEAAGDLCLSHRLRAYDAVQLACALALREYALINQAPLPILVCADRGLLDVAGVEGLQIENPNNYP